MTGAAGAAPPHDNPVLRKGSIGRFIDCMHDVLRNRVMRKIETLPEEQIYQVLDYIEFLETRYAPDGRGKEASGFQKLGEGIEDGLRKRSLNPSNLREAFQVIAAADRALSGVARAGRELLGELAEGVRGSLPDDRSDGGDDEGDEGAATHGGGPEDGARDDG